MAETLEKREAGLKRELSARLLGGIALGQSIGTGLFLGSAVAVQMAGPGVILSYVAGAAITFLVMKALAEMTAAHPVAGSFGAYAELYLGPWAGWVTRYTYCMAQVVATGSQMVAVAIYCSYWFPSVPGWIWMAVFSLLLVGANSMHVARFGEFEFWFSLVKVAAIVLFIVFGSTLLMTGWAPRPGFGSLDHFLPRGWFGVWAGVTMAIFSFYGLEAAAISSGEARNPGATVPRALRNALACLTVFYLTSISLLVAFIPADEAGIHESPFVTVYRMMGIPAAAGLMNFIVLTAALSSINSNLYVTSRTLFSLARAGQIGSALGKLDTRGIPVRAVIVSGLGLALAAAAQRVFAESAFTYMLGAALFGGVFCWIMILATHIRFRRARGHKGPLASMIGFGLVLAVLVTMAGIGPLAMSWVAGLPWLVLVTLVYFLKGRFPARPSMEDREPTRTGP